jgi:putative transposase
MPDPSKISKRKATKLANKQRRKALDKKVYQIKIDESYLSKQKKKDLDSCFIQSKWIQNYRIGESKIFDPVKPVTQIPVFVFNPLTQKCDKQELRDITIGSQIAQNSILALQQDVKNLAKAKAKGIKVGALKFKKSVDTVLLPQYGTTYKILNKNYLRIQGIGKLRVRGLSQVADLEKAQAHLVKDATGYYVKILCYKEKKVAKTDSAIGVDFGIKDSIVLSNGEKFSYNFPIPKELKRKQKCLSRKKKGSKSYVQQLYKLKKSYQNLTNRKDDAANKIVAYLKTLGKIIIQDENIKGWHANLFGKQIQQSILGRIKSRIQNLETSIVINRWLPTTKISPVTGKNIQIKLNERIFIDGNFQEDRDIKSAKTILCLGLFSPKLTRKELMSLPVEEIVSIFQKFYPFEEQTVPNKTETGSHSPLGRGSSLTRSS